MASSYVLDESTDLWPCNPPNASYLTRLQNGIPTFQLPVKDEVQFFAGSGPGVEVAGAQDPSRRNQQGRRRQINVTLSLRKVTNASRLMTTNEK